MVPEKIKTKSLINKSMAGDSDLKLINEHTINPLSVEDVFVFKVKLCDNDMDRVFDKMTDKFLNNFAEKAKSLTGITNHDWDADGQMSRLYDTEVVEEDGVTNKLGEPYKYVLGKAYTLTKFKDYIDKISSGLLKETSVSFKSTSEVCSICGKPTHKGPDNIAVCDEGHTMGETYDGKIAYNSLEDVDDVFEWSLVAVPCQRESGVINKSCDGFKDAQTKYYNSLKNNDDVEINKNLDTMPSNNNSGVVNKSCGGTNLMKKGALFLTRWLKSKGLEANDVDIEQFKSEEDVTEDDIKEILAENDRLQEENKNLKAELDGLKAQTKADKIETACKAYVESLNPLTPVVTENILGEIDRDKITLGEDGSISDIEELFKPVVEKYKGLFKEPEVKESTAEEVADSVNVAPKTNEDEPIVKKSFSPTFSISSGSNAETSPSVKTKGFVIK